jgi:class 3 adenylate cyclase
VAAPATRYARSGDLHIAYQVVGDGPVDLLYVPGWISQLDLYWEHPSVARFLRRLASFSRLVLFDKRGIGLSDRPPGPDLPTLEERMDDVRAVLDEVGSRRAAIFAQGYGSPLGAVFAATYPDRVSALVLYSPIAKAGARTDDYPWGSTPEELDAWRERSTIEWGTHEFAAEWLRRLAPTDADDAASVAWVARVMRSAASPAGNRAYGEMNAAMDVRDVLPAVRVPTLVLERSDAWTPKSGVDFPPLEEARYVASLIPDAAFAVLPGRDYLPWVGDQEALAREVAAFVGGTAPRAEAKRMLVTILFTDIVGSTAHAARLGDRRWSELLEEHDELLAEALDRHGGHEIDRAGDGFFATFDGPARAIRCAKDVTAAARGAGLELRAGIHTGEVEVVEGRVTGIAVHLGARVAAKAHPGEVLVTRTVRDLVAGSGIGFADRGAHALKGVDGRWRLYAALD